MLSLSLIRGIIIPSCWANFLRKAQMRSKTVLFFRGSTIEISRTPTKTDILSMSSNSSTGLPSAADSPAGTGSFLPACFSDIVICHPIVPVPAARTRNGSFGKPGTNAARAIITEAIIKGEPLRSSCFVKS